MGAMLSHNFTRKNDQPVVHAFRLMNRVEHNYSTIGKLLQWFLLCTSLDII